MIFFLVIVLPVLVIDQLTKFVVLQNFQPGETLPVISDIFHISLVFNKGVAFGIFSRTPAVFTWLPCLSAAVLILIVMVQRRMFRDKGSTRVFLSLILAGAAGNLIDRMRWGYVVDFLDFRIWPVFNIADCAITVGIALLILQMLRQKSTASHQA